jgi:hypothetical protein
VTLTWIQIWAQRLARTVYFNNGIYNPHFAPIQEHAAYARQYGVCPEQPFPLAQLGREELKLAQKFSGTSGTVEHLGGSRQAEDSVTHDSGATVRPHNMSQQNRRWIDRWWNDLKLWRTEHAEYSNCWQRVWDVNHWTTSAFGRVNCTVHAYSGVTMVRFDEEWGIILLTV